MGQGTSKHDFEWKSDRYGPHRDRRTAILKAHPEIQKLFVVDPLFKWKVTAMVVFQVISLYLFRDLSTTTLMFLAYFLGGTINHSLMLALHEIHHCQAFGHAHPELNRWFGIFANLPIGVPVACSFKKYHQLHHQFLSTDGIDVDLPTDWEGRVFRTPLMKTLWLLMQPLFYGLRPFVVNPLPPCELEIVNVLLQFAFDFVIYQFFGLRMLGYLLFGSSIAMGLHPIAGHFIAEHYLLTGDNKFETSSYLGPLNHITWNVGYHVAHHDFPSIPYRYLPEVHKLAPEFYDHLPTHTSWTQCIIQFIFNPDVGPYARMKRPPTSDDKAQDSRKQQ